MNTIIIDTSNNQEIKVGLRIGDKEYITLKRGSKWKSQVVLPVIDKLLKKHTRKLKDINSIEVNTGPGSFTGLRVGIAIANALSYALNIPVNNQQKGEFVDATYS